MEDEKKVLEEKKYPFKKTFSVNVGDNKLAAVFNFFNENYTRCDLYDFFLKDTFQGVAKKHPDDVYNETEAMRFSLKRALAQRNGSLKSYVSEVKAFCENLNVMGSEYLTKRVLK